MNIQIGRCEIIVFLFFVLITALETTALYLCFSEGHRHFMNLTRVIVYTSTFNAAIMWFTFKYTKIKDRMSATNE